MTMKRTLLASVAVMAFATPAFAQSSTTVTTTAKQYFAQHHRPPCEDETEHEHDGGRRSARPVAQYFAQHHRPPCEDETEDEHEHDGERRSARPVPGLKQRGLIGAHILKRKDAGRAFMPHETAQPRSKLGA